MLIFLSLITFSLWTLSFSLGKIALLTSSPIFLTAFRMGFAGLLILLYLFIKQSSSFTFPKKYLLPLSLFSFLSVYLTNIFEFWGLQYVSAAKACFLYSLSPFFSIILSYIHFREKLSLQKSLGLIIALIALLPVLSFQSGNENLFNSLFFISWPELSVIGAAFCSTYGWIILRILYPQRPEGLNIFLVSKSG